MAADVEGNHALYDLEDRLERRDVRHRIAGRNHVDLGRCRNSQRDDAACTLIVFSEA
jgi:hypothetical protein